MKRRIIAVASLGLIAVLAGLLYLSGYELRLVPNEPDLRPQTVQPSPLELGRDFALAGGSERENRGFPQRKIVDLASMFPKLFFREGSLKEKRIALTFDDGPDSTYTQQMLDILNEHNVKGTFFLIGNRAQIFPEVVKRMVEGGHIVANHTMNHPNILKLNKKKTREEIMQAEDILFELTGYRTTLFRSPYGSLDPDKVREIEQLGYKIIAWNVDSLDWKSLSAEQVKTNILENVRSGSIILQHSSGSEKENLTGSVAALRDIIVTLKKEGYRFVTIPELLDLPYKKQ